jgi:hypothetical protein
VDTCSNYEELQLAANNVNIEINKRPASMNNNNFLHLDNMPLSSTSRRDSSLFDDLNDNHDDDEEDDDMTTTKSDKILFSPRVRRASSLHSNHTHTSKSLKSITLSSPQSSPRRASQLKNSPRFD